jgi:hypothetical protein
MDTQQLKERIMAPQAQQALKTGGDLSAIGALAGWFAGLLPTVATLFTVIWFGILITEKVTGKPFAELVRCAWGKIRRS